MAGIRRWRGISELGEENRRLLQRILWWGVLLAVADSMH